VVYVIKSSATVSAPLPDSRRADALHLAEELLGEIEYSRLGASDIAKKAGRLARLVDDADAMAWLRSEVAGYTKPGNGFMTLEEVAAAERSNRFMELSDAGVRKYKVESIGEIQAHIESANASLSALAGAPASGELALLVENSRRDQRYAIWGRIATERGYLDGILGSIHDYVAQRYQSFASVRPSREPLRRCVRTSTLRSQNWSRVPSRG
jgi:hypothetical protein